MSKSRHQRHIRTLDSLNKKGWHVIAAWNANRSMGCSCTIHWECPGWHYFHLFNGKSDGYYAPPFVQMPYTVFVAKRKYERGREVVLHGWKELREFTESPERWIEKEGGR